MAIIPVTEDGEQAAGQKVNLQRFTLQVDPVDQGYEVGALVGGCPMPVLQLYAAHKDDPLVVYTDKILDIEKELSDGVAVSFNYMSIQAQPSDEYPIPIDLDVWLDMPWGVFGGKPLTNREAIKSIANTVGSHFDQDALPLTIALRTTKSELHGLSADSMLLYIGHVAMIVMQLGRAVLRDE